MEQLLFVLFLSLLAGLAIPVGALLACWERVSPDWMEEEFRHSVIAFGGGLLLSAVALVLVPEGVRHLSLVWIVVCFLSGGLFFYGLERAMQSSGSSASQLLATVSDFLPESIAMGAGFATGASSGAVLALLIGLQNLPEGFNAYREIRQTSKVSAGRLIGLFCLVALLGPVAAWFGYVILSPYPRIVGGISLFAAAGILYLTFQDIAPQSALKNHRAPALGAVLGFLGGLLGDQILG